MNQVLSFSFGVVLATAATVASAAPATYTVDLNHTSVTAESRHFGTSTMHSHFMARSGSIALDTAAKTGKANIVIDVTSAYTGVAKLDGELKGDTFLGAAYPEATFTATDFTFDGDKVTQISGDLTMHGKTGPLTLKSTNYNCYMSPMSKKFVCGGEFVGTIQRSLWDVKYLIPLVSDETKLVVEIEAAKD